MPTRRQIEVAISARVAFLGAGYSGSCWRTQDIVVKVYRSKLDFAREYGFLGDLLSLAPTLKIPALLDGGWLDQLERPFVAYRYIRGVRPMADSVSMEEARQIGTLLARLHKESVGYPSTSVPGHSELELMASLASTLPDRTRGAILGLTQVIKERSQGSVNRHVRIHGDVRPSNIVIRGSEASLLDFASSYWELPEHEFRHRDAWPKSCMEQMISSYEYVSGWHLDRPLMVALGCFRELFLEFQVSRGMVSDARVRSVEELLSVYD